MIYGYARVSTHRQDLSLQVKALMDLGIEERHIVCEEASGGISSKERRGLSSLLDRMQAGDTLVVWKLDRLGRSLIDLVKVSETLKERGIHLRSLTENFDTTSPCGVVIFAIIAAVAEMEHAYARERIMAGLAAARADGRYIGRKRKLTERQANNLVKAYLAGDSINVLCKRYKLCRTTVLRYLERDGIVPEVDPPAVQLAMVRAERRAMGKPLGRKLKLTERRMKNLVRKYQEGVPVRVLSKDYGLTEWSVRRHLRLHGVQFKHKPKLSEQQVEDLVRKYQEGVPVRVLSKHYSLTERSVRRHLRLHGIQFDGKGNRNAQTS
ncbi:MAG: recombinase family protein [Synergistaceae bacterium]|nr:recombinase family protein [Synergistaceae bacterium]